MFKPGQIVICIDEANSESNALCVIPILQHMKEYIVEDYFDNFVKLEGVKGEWHEGFNTEGEERIRAKDVIAYMECIVPKHPGKM